MHYTSQELILSDSLLSLLYLLAIVGLAYYYRQLGFSYLRLGAVALGFALLSQLFGGFVLHFGIDDLFLVSLAANLGFSLYMYAVLISLAERSVSLMAIGATILASIAVGVAVVLLDVPPEPGWMAVDLPGIVLLLVGIVAMLRVRRTAASYSLAVLLLLHSVCRGAVPFLGYDESLYSTAFMFSGVLCLLAGAVLTMNCAEQLMASLGSNEDRLRQFEQENRRLELQFSQAQKHESLGVMAGGIAHDFNNMLTSVLGYTSLAMKKLPPESEVRKDLYMVMSGARQAVDLTSQMLVYAGKGAIEFESVDLSKVVDNMSGLVNSIVPRKIRLVNRVSRDLPLVKGDSVQLGQIVMNLVANAVDAIENKEGAIEIHTGLSEVNESTLRESWFAEDHESGAYVYLKVIDSGQGMEPGQIERIFDPFYSDKKESKGLGLSSISGIVRQHKGFVQVESERGKGSRFTVYFPVIAYQDFMSRSGSMGSSAGPRLKARVLLADDDPRIRSLIASILESDGYAISSAEDGREASRLIEKSGSDFDLFVLDCTMPKMSGPEVFRQIRNSRLTQPVVLISGYHQEQVINDISKDDDAYFIKKPFGVDELIETANAAIAKRSGSSQPG